MRLVLRLPLLAANTVEKTSRIDVNDGDKISFVALGSPLFLRLFSFFFAQFLGMGRV